MTLTFILVILAICGGVLLLWILWNGPDEFPVYEANATGPRGVCDDGPCPEIVSRIFSAEDRAFVAALHSRRLLRLYRTERSKVALHWVGTISQEVRRIMREHRLQSRHSQNLDVAIETKLLLQYLRLQVVCGLLFVLIRSFGPQAVCTLAAHAGALQQRIARVLQGSSLAARVVPTGDTTTY
jgi:hypothetical protein